MTRSELLRKIYKAARKQGVTITLSERTNHSLFTIGKTNIWMPRSERIKPGTQKGILKQLEEEFGKGWHR
jgi:hypothetical protein